MLRAISRRAFLVGASVAAINQAVAWSHGIHADDVIPVTTLTPGNFAANAFTGFTSLASTVFTSGGFNYLRPNPDVVSPQLAITSYVTRDSRCSTYFGRGAIILRLNGSPGSQSCFYFQYNSAVTGGDIRVGITTGYNQNNNYEGNGTQYTYYVNTNVAASAEGIAAGFTNSYSSGDLFTFGVEGFQVYLQWNGIDLVRYTEWRLMASGKCGVWVHDGYGARDITVHYPTQTFLYSNSDAGIFDIRDFGTRSVAAVTGTISAGSNQLVIASNVGFRVGDRVIVEIGGESGAGARGTIGVGGQWPILSYPDLATMNADTSKTNGVFAYLLTNNFVYSTTGGVWSRDTTGAGAYNQGYYSDLTVPLSLLATVTAVSANGLTLTLNTTATVAATSANVWLDCADSFFLINQSSGNTVPPMSATAYASAAVTLSVPTGNWRLSRIIEVSTSAPINFTLPQSGFNVVGAGKTLTTLTSPKGVPSGAINLTSTVANNTVISDMKHVGNIADNGFMFKPTTFGAYNGWGDSDQGFYISAAGATTGLILRNLDIVDCFGRAGVISGGTSPLIDSCSATLTVGQRQYMQWLFSLINATGGTIQDCAGTGAFLTKIAELFACNGASMVRITGTNGLMSFNSCTNCSADTPTLTIGANSFFDTLSGGIDEPIISINNNAFGTGNTITITNPRIIQSGYIDASNNSLKAIQVIHTAITDVTISGQYPGGGGCSTTLGGLIQAPNYDPGSAEYGSMAVLSDAARTIVSGIRVKGSAIGTPGHSGHFSNISILGASSQVTNCVVDVVQTGPTLSGNQTNAAYGGC
jgi:hypothetical protein